MTDQIPFEIRELFDLYKRYLLQTGPIIEQEQVDEVWKLFNGILDDLEIDYMEYWYYTGGKISDIQVHSFGGDEVNIYTDEDKAELVSNWKEMPVAFVEIFTDEDEISVYCRAPFFSSLPKHKAGASILISGIHEKDEKIWEWIMIELSLLIEIINSRIIVKNSRFSENVDKLTPAQYRVLKEIGNSQDRTNTAYTLGISPDTYDDHLRAIREKLTTSSRYRPSLDRIRTNFSKYGIAKRELASLKQKISGADE